METLKKSKSSQKNLLCSLCKKEMDIEYHEDGNIIYPVFSCNEHGIKNIWKEWWENYSDLWKIDDKWSDKKDLPTCIVSYILYKHKEKFGFSFKMNKSNPVIYCSREYKDARKIILNFGEDYQSIRNYLKWCFSEKIKKNPIKSFGYFAHTELINEYLFSKHKSKKIIRSTKLPEDFLEWVKNNYPDIINKYELSTYNDLNCMVPIENNDVENIINEARNRKILPQSGIKKLEE